MVQNDPVADLKIGLFTALVPWKEGYRSLHFLYVRRLIGPGRPRDMGLSLGVESCGEKLRIRQPVD